MGTFSAGRDGFFTWLAAERGRLTWCDMGAGEGERTRPAERNSPLAFSCSAFVRRYLAIPCYSNHTMRYKAAGGCSRSVPPPPLSSSSSSFFSLHHIISHLNRILAEWSRGRWKWTVHRPLTVLRSQEATCRLCSFRCGTSPGLGAR